MPTQADLDRMEDDEQPVTSLDPVVPIEASSVEKLAALSAAASAGLDVDPSHTLEACKNKFSGEQGVFQLAELRAIFRENDELRRRAEYAESETANIQRTANLQAETISDLLGDMHKFIKAHPAELDRYHKLEVELYGEEAARKAPHALIEDLRAKVQDLELKLELAEYARDNKSVMSEH